MVRFGLAMICLFLAGCGGSALDCSTDAKTGNTLCVGPGVTEMQATVAMSDVPRDGAVTHLRDKGGIAHTVETKMTGPTTMIETHTYGTPPPAKTANKPMASSASRGCTYAMVGGTSYVCKPN